MFNVRQEREAEEVVIPVQKALEAGGTLQEVSMDPAVEATGTTPTGAGPSAGSRGYRRCRGRGSNF